MAEETRIPRIRITSTSRANDGEECSISLEGLRANEFDAIKLMLLGLAWISTDDSGRITVSPAKEPLPMPTEDAEMLPFWRKHHVSPGDTQIQEEIFDPDRFQHIHHSPIYIQHLCGYNYTDDNFTKQAKNLSRWGFECMRSRRGEEGKFWEVWYLPGVWAAKEELKEAIGSTHTDYSKRAREELEQAINFLRKHAEFGTLDVSVQRLAMVID